MLGNYCKELGKRQAYTAVETDGQTHRPADRLHSHKRLTRGRNRNTAEISDRLCEKYGRPDDRLAENGTTNTQQLSEKAYFWDITNSSELESSTR